MTDHDLLDLAKAEELRLLKRLKAVRAIIDAYIAGDDSRTPYRRPYVRRRSHSRSDTMIRQIEVVAVEYLRQHGRRAKSKELLSIMNEHGIYPAGNRPEATLAANLSMNPLFDNVPGEGYGLVEWKNGPDTAADAGEISPHTLEVASWRW